MPIRRGEPWGIAAPLPAGAPAAHTNAELRALVSEQQEGARPQGPIGVLGGDLWQVAGAPSGGVERLRSAQAQTVPADLIAVEADGRRLWACAHAVARNSWWRGPVVAAMNADRLGEWRLAPAAHPNDGRLHLLATGLRPMRSAEAATGAGPQRDEASATARRGHSESVADTGRDDRRARLGIGQRLLARRRLRSGTHLPHPAISVQRAADAAFEFERDLGLWLDGERVGRCRRLRVSVVPDGVILVF